MHKRDLHLLVSLNVLLSEKNVARAAQRLGLSASAMSRSLARLRSVTGDPLLVRAAQGLVPTPRAIELAGRIGQIIQEAEAVLSPAARIDLTALDRCFTVRTSDGFVETFGPRIILRVAAQAPGVQLRFVLKPDRDSAPLRDGSVDFETGVIGKATGPEIRAVTLFRDRFIGVVRDGHPLARGKMSAARYAAGEHVVESRSGRRHDLIDGALESLGLSRKIAVLVGGFSAALALARASDLIATVPERHTEGLRAGMHGFAVPLKLPAIGVSLLWHPRMEADQAHRWLRACIRESCDAHIRLSTPYGAG